MEDVLRMMFGFGPRRQQLPQPRLQQQNEDGTERVMLSPDTSASAVAARHNMAQIYGRANVPQNFGMRPVIEVRDASGEWVPVSGSRDAVPDGMTQIAYLQNYRKTGQIGVTPLADDAIVGQVGQISDTQQTASADQNAQPQQPQQPMIAVPLSFGGQGQEGGAGTSAIALWSGIQQQQTPQVLTSQGGGETLRDVSRQTSEVIQPTNPSGPTIQGQQPGVSTRAGAHPTSLSEDDVNRAAARGLPGARPNGMGGGAGFGQFQMPNIGMLLL